MRRCPDCSIELEMVVTNGKEVALIQVCPNCSLEIPYDPSADDDDKEVPERPSE